MPTAFVLTIMFAHWVGDFVLQTDEMAKLKSRDAHVLFTHVFTWALPLVLGLMVYDAATGLQLDAVNGLIWVAFNIGAHYLLDSITSKMNMRYQAQGNVKAFWNTIGFDQWCHLALLLGSAEWLLK